MFFVILLVITPLLESIQEPDLYESLELERHLEDHELVSLLQERSDLTNCEGHDQVALLQVHKALSHMTTHDHAAKTEEMHGEIKSAVEDGGDASFYMQEGVDIETGPREVTKNASHEKIGSLPMTVNLADHFQLQALSNDSAIELVDGLTQSGALLKARSEEASRMVQQSARSAALGGAILFRKAQAMVDPDHIQLRGPLKTQAGRHVANRVSLSRKVIPKPEFKTVDFNTVERFTGRTSVFQDERVVLTVVCFLIIMWSSFMSTLRQGQKGMASREEHVTPVKMFSVWDSTVTSFSTIVGMGLLSMPYAMSVAGMIGAPIIAFFVGCSAYTAHLMAWAFNSEIQKMKETPGALPTNLGWGFLVRAAFGPKAGHAVNLFLVVELWGYLLSGVVAAGMNLNQLVDEVSVASAIALCVLGIYVLSSVPARLISQVNAAANILFCIVCGMFIVTGLSLPSKAPASDIQYVKPHGILVAAGIIVFSPAAHSVFPSLMQHTEDPKEFPRIMRRSYSAAAAIYLFFAVIGYYLFGNAVQPSAVQNIGVDLHLRPIPNMGWMNSVAAFCMVVKIGAAQPLTLLPLTSTVEGLLKGKLDEGLSMVLVPPVILTITAVVAMHFASEMASLLNVVGSIFCMNIAFVLPVLCYWKLSKGKVSFIQKIIFGGLAAMGLSFAVLGVISAVEF